MIDADSDNAVYNFKLPDYLIPKSSVQPLRHAWHLCRWSHFFCLCFFLSFFAGQWMTQIDDETDAVQCRRSVGTTAALVTDTEAFV
jgi:peptidoglycan/LPS O-acetylase OafA/YrhL